MRFLCENAVFKFLRRCLDGELIILLVRNVPLFSFFLKVRMYLCSGHVF